jgi:hypothetical protein
MIVWYVPEVDRLAIQFKQGNGYFVIIGDMGRIGIIGPTKKSLKKKSWVRIGEL